KIITLCGILLAASMRPLFGIMLVGCSLLPFCMKRGFKFAIVALVVPVVAAAFSQYLYDAAQISESFFAAYAAADTPLDYYARGLSAFDNPISAVFAFLFRFVGNAFSTMGRF